MAKKAIPSSPFAIYLGQSLLATLHTDAFFTISKRHQAKTKAENGSFQVQNSGFETEKFSWV